MDQEKTSPQTQSDNPSSSADFVVSTDDRPIYEAWRKGGADEALAYTATQRVRDMAAVNAVTFMGAKIEVQGAELRTRIEAQGARIEAQGAELRTRIEAQGARIEAQGAELRAKIEEQGARIEAQGAELRAKIEEQGARIEAQGVKIEAQGAELGTRIDAQGAELGARIEAQRTVLAAHTTSLRWMMGILVAVFAALMVLLAQAVREIPTPAPSTAALQQPIEEPNADDAPAAASSTVSDQAPQIGQESAR